MKDAADFQKKLILGIMLAVLVWGAILAAGAYLHGGALGLRNALLTLACVGGFLGIWIYLLRRRHRQKGPSS